MRARKAYYQIHISGRSGAGVKIGGECQGQTGIAYSISNPGDTYATNWSYVLGGTGATITNPNSQYSATVDFSPTATSGTLRVAASNTCGTSAPRDLAITVNTTPATPGLITGSIAVCPLSTNAYSIAAVSGATSYTWVLPGGWTGSSTTTSINATASSSNGTITVKANNSSCSSTVQSLTITNGVPLAPGTITGNASNCSGAAATYSVAAVTGATSYTWSQPTGWTGTSTTNSITYSVVGVAGNISVTANNSCGSSTSAAKAITVTSVPTFTKR